jgi:hypothetical protein
LESRRRGKQDRRLNLSWGNDGRLIPRSTMIDGVDQPGEKLHFDFEGNTKSTESCTHVKSSQQGITL